MSKAVEAIDPVSKLPRLLIIFTAVQSLVPISPFAAPTAQRAADSVFTVGGDVSAPRAIFQVDAKYTDEALAAGISGIVQLWRPTFNSIFSKSRLQGSDMMPKTELPD